MLFLAGSISAYVLMGIIWAAVYSLFLHLQPGSFAKPEHLQSGSVVGLCSIYFSFTTLTTLGYGDIFPQLHAVQSYAVMEAACGQIFLTVLVVHLVALHIIHSNIKIENFTFHFGAASGSASTSTVSIQRRRAGHPWNPETFLR